MITSFATVRTMMSICDIFMRTLCVGTTTNYTPKNRGMGFALCLCNTKAKLAIKQNDKPVTVCQELFEKIQIKKGVTTKPKSSNNFEC